MPNPKTGISKDDNAPPSDLPASPGTDSVAETPKDVPPDAATARDRTVRKITSDNLEEREESLLDDAVEATFPASDPIAVPSYEEAEAIIRRKAEKAAKSSEQPAAPK